MKNYSNFYIFMYATVLVVIVAAILAFTAVTLKEPQEKNIEIKKKRDILSSISIESTVDDAEALYSKNITNTFIVKSNGEISEGDAFNIDLKTELAKTPEDMQLPLFECTQNGIKRYIIPVLGKGLWGPIWGYISLEADLNTIYGATFAHKSETPGLGAEIDTKGFQAPFVGKTIFDESGKFVSIIIEKGGAKPGDNHAVDAISGGTITSKALEETIYKCLANYETYFNQHKSN
ncbi:MAG: NADH:ubiquinone reductase (Na(+)-transporting) subunit C [Saprospiraceae bacterium]|nr:NADH:ubiquinone reductase (Na(+)-transporting) subunit C [Saprospiraceae bacterium]